MTGGMMRATPPRRAAAVAPSCAVADVLRARDRNDQDTGDDGQQPGELPEPKRFSKQDDRQQHGEQRCDVAERCGDHGSKRAVAGKRDQGQQRREHQPHGGEDRHCTPNDGFAVQQERRSQQEAQRERRYADRRAGQGMDVPQPELRQHQAATQEDRSGHGKEDGGHGLRALAGSLRLHQSPDCASRLANRGAVL